MSNINIILLVEDIGWINRQASPLTSQTWPNLPPPPYFAQCKKLEAASLGMMLEWKLHKHFCCNFNRFWLAKMITWLLFLELLIAHWFKGQMAICVVVDQGINGTKEAWLLFVNLAIKSFGSEWSSTISPNQNSWSQLPTLQLVMYVTTLVSQARPNQSCDSERDPRWGWLGRVMLA